MNEIIYFNTLIEPKGGITSLVVFVVVLMLVITIPIMVITYGLSKKATLTLTESELIINSAFYGRTIALGDIAIRSIRSINLETDNDYDIAYRRNGVGTPTMKIGWMKLKNGERALCFITDKTSAVLIPTKDYPILFSMTNIDEFIQKIQSLSGR